MEKYERKQLQTLQSIPEWEALENFLTEYLNNCFKVDTIKRETEFDTIWEQAKREGGKEHLINFFKVLEEEARKYD